MQYFLTQEEYDELNVKSDDEEVEEQNYGSLLYGLISHAKIHSYSKPEELNREYVAIEFRVDELPEPILELIRIKLGKQNEQN